MRLKTTLIISLLIAALALGCSDDKNPAAPVAGEAVPVTAAAQIEGRWNSVQAWVDGLPLNTYTVPAFGVGRYDAVIAAWSSGLTVTRTGEASALFSLQTEGTSVDTAGSGLMKSGGFDYWGDLVLDGDGGVSATLRTGRSKDRPFVGQASLLADTLVLNFTLSSPPEKAVGFLPNAQTSFIARLVRQ
ncbi:hypothetical protein LLH00_01525 [bacterium]|nr:hypothetical protein [bacterium]